MNLDNRGEDTRVAKQNFFQSIGSFLGNAFKPRQQMPQPKTAQQLNLPNNSMQQFISQTPLKINQTSPKVPFNVPLSPNTFSAAPSATRQGSQAQGASFGNYIPGQGYGSQANLTSPNSYTTSNSGVRQDVVPPQVPGQPQQSQSSSQPTVPGQSGGQSSGGAPALTGNPTADAQTTMQASGQQLMQDLANAYMSGGIDPNKPFALDEFLARNAATQAISPYYAQVNQRFQQGIRNLIQSGQLSTQRGLQGIQQTGETQQNKLLRLLQSGQQSTGQQYSGQGLYDSGERARAQGLMGATTSQELSNYLGGQQRDIASTQQQQTDLLNRLYLQKQETQNQLARNQGQDVEAAVQESQRQAATKAGVSALEGQPLTGSNMQDYFNQRAKALSNFLPNA